MRSNEALGLALIFCGLLVGLNVVGGLFALTGFFVFWRGPAAE